MLLHYMVKIEPSLVCTVNFAEVLKATLLNVTLFRRKYVVYTFSSICYTAALPVTTAFKSCSRSASKARLH